MSGGGGAFGGGMVAGIGSLMEASDIDNAYQDEAKKLDSAARVTRSNAQYNAKKQMLVASKKIGAISSDYAASGVASDSGSVLDVIAASHANAELDRLEILHQGELKAQGYEMKASQDRFSGDHARDIGYFNAFTSVFTGSARGQQMSGEKVEKSNPNTSVNKKKVYGDDEPSE